MIRWAGPPVCGTRRTSVDTPAKLGISCPAEKSLISLMVPTLWRAMAESLTDVEAEIEKLEARHGAEPQGRFFVPLADAYRRGGQVERAERLLREALRRHPEYLSAHVVLGRCLEDRGAVEEAASEFRYVLSVDPQNLIALRRLGELAVAAGRAGEATEWYEQLLAVDPANDDARRALQSVPSEEFAGEQQHHAVDADGRDEHPQEEQRVLKSEPDDDPVGAEPDDSLGNEVVTETIAELYARQGLADRAAAVYRELIRRRGGDPALEARLAELEAEQPQSEPWASAEHGAEAAETPAAEEFDPFDSSFETGFPRAGGVDQPPTITGFLRELVSWSPHSPPALDEAADEALDEAGEPREGAGEPLEEPWNEPEPLLGEVAFPGGAVSAAPDLDDTPEVHPEEVLPSMDGTGVTFPWEVEGEQESSEPLMEERRPSGGPSASAGEAAGVAEEPRAGPVHEEDDDLESFQAWLRSLKR
jgi:tetratricopeptide (TPR) repeat protein